MVRSNKTRAVVAVLGAVAIAALTTEAVSADTPPAFRITDVRLNPGGFQPCPNAGLAIGMPVGQHNPDAPYLKCVTAQVTVSVQGTAKTRPTLAANLEAWGFSVIDGRRYDSRSAPQLYPQTYRSDATGVPVQSIWTWPTAVVTDYDGKLEWADAGPPGGSVAGSSVPPPIRDHLQSPGALVLFSLAGQDSPSVRCRYFGPNGVAPDRLVCEGLPVRPRTPANAGQSDRGQH